MLRLKVITFAVLLLCGIGMYSHSYIFKNCDLTTQYHSSLPVAPQNYWVCWMLTRLGALLAQSLSKLYTDLQPKFLSSEKFGCRKYISILLLILFFSRYLLVLPQIKTCLEIILLSVFQIYFLQRILIHTKLLHVLR